MAAACTGVVVYLDSRVQNEGLQLGNVVAVQRRTAAETDVARRRDP
jgi:hypothetical protein